MDMDDMGEQWWTPVVRNTERGMIVRNNELCWCENQGAEVLTHNDMTIVNPHVRK